MTKSDKGNAVVVMNSAYYHKQIEQMLQDKKVYKRITDKRRNPTSKIETELQERLLILKTKGNLTEQEYKKLRPSDSYPAAFYGLPKIHKVSLSEQDDHFTVDPNTEIPMRPIISSINSPIYEISKHLAQILKYLYNDSHTVKNSKEFADFVSRQIIDVNEKIVSFDVVSLFTSIPVDLAIQIVKEELSNKKVWEQHTKLHAHQIIQLLQFVLNNSYFMYECSHYHQVFGCPMGSPVSAVIAELVMQRIEKIALASSPIPIRWWKRYVDDSNACIKETEISTFHSHLNSINPHIQFTLEMPVVNKNNQTISFLDTEVIGNPSGNVTVRVFRKNTHTNKYLSFESHCHVNDKRTVVKTLLDRAKSIPSTAELTSPRD